jgi:hypothetical protein
MIFIVGEYQLHVIDKLQSSEISRMLRSFVILLFSISYVSIDIVLSILIVMFCTVMVEESYNK